MTLCPAISRRTPRTWIAHALLLAFVCRALVPAGFMPDFGALTKGVFKVVICSAGGSKVVALDADGKPAHTSGAHASQPCAFSGLAAVAAPDLGPDLHHPAFAQTAIAKANTATALPPARAGPVLGSRGPPLLS